MMMNAGRMLRIDEAAVALGLKPSTIRKMVLQGRIAVFRPTPRAVRIAESTISEILKKGYRPAVTL